MMSMILFLIFLTGLYPIGIASWSNRKTTLIHGVFWAMVGWIFWTYVVLEDASRQGPEFALNPFMALGLTGCASIAVLGARRPGALAWNFVVLGLYAVIMLMWLEGRWAGDDRILHRVRTVLLASAIVIGVLNYLPTRLAPAAALLAISCGLEILRLAGSDLFAGQLDAARQPGRLILALVPWTAYTRMRWQPLPRSEFDQVWLRFRNSFGLFWAQRLREQFNQSAKNSNWPVVLRWQGLRVIAGSPPPSPEDRLEMLANLRALMKRFEGPEKKAQ